MFWEFTMFLCKFDLSQVRRNLISSKINFEDELPHELPNNLRSTILEDQELKTKSQNWVEAQAGFQFPFQKLVFGDTGQNIAQKMKFSIKDIFSKCD